jgi:hypothetical protein
LIVLNSSRDGAGFENQNKVTLSIRIETDGTEIEKKLPTIY